MRVADGLQRVVGDELSDRELWVVAAKLCPIHTFEFLRTGCVLLGHACLVTKLEDSLTRLGGTVMTHLLQVLHLDELLSLLAQKSIAFI